MSKKASGPLISVPDLPVLRYSQDMDICFETLYRTVSRGLRVPDSIDSIIGLVKHLQELYYRMRDQLEADNGVSLATVESLPPIDDSPLLKMLYSWETDSQVGFNEYKKRDIQITQAPLYPNACDRFLSYEDCWKQYRLWMFEANRALAIARQRVCLKTKSAV